MTSTTRAVFLLLALSITIASLQAKPTAPDWVPAVAAKPASIDYGKAKAAVLLDECSIKAETADFFTERTRMVFRILTKDGKENAKALVPFDKGSDKVKSFQAWIIKPNGDVIAFGKKETVETAFQENTELYSENRLLQIIAEDDAEAGCIFAYEAIVEEKSVFTNNSWYFQSSLPVEYSAITYNLLPGWKIEGRTFNHAPVEPIIKGNQTTWELHSLPAIKNEPLSPPTKAWLGINILPSTKTIRVPFTSWADISNFYTDKYDASSAPSAAIKAKADSLVAGATTLWKRIYPLCRQAQKVNYISIDLNLAHAGGYIPRDADKVLRTNYGDCKDKASFLRALLATQGIESFPLIVNSGSGRYVAPDWPSPTQFNHAILAIKVDDTVVTPAVIDHPILGRLLIFDATNPYAPPGLLPEEDCGGHGLLIAGNKGELITLPELQPQNNQTELKITAKLQANGTVDGSIEEKTSGLASTEKRSIYRTLSSADYRKQIERKLNGSMPAATLTKIEPDDHFDQAEFSLQTQFTAPNHGKSMRDVLLIFKPVLVSRLSGASLKKEKRLQPIVITPESFSEKSQIELPAEFHIDELPAPIELKSAFGKYSARVTADGTKNILVERSLELSLATIPAADYDSVRSFFEKIAQAEQAPVVLRRN